MFARREGNGRRRPGCCPARRRPPFSRSADVAVILLKAAHLEAAEIGFVRQPFNRGGQPAIVVVIGIPETTDWERIRISSTIASAPDSVEFMIHWISFSLIRSSRFGRPREMRNTARVLIPAL